MEESWIEKQIMEGHGVVIRPAPDNGVTVNGVGLWPDGPKDHQGYVYGSKGPWSARYNFETGSASATYHGEDSPMAGARVVAMMLMAIALGTFVVILSVLLGWWR